MSPDVSQMSLRGGASVVHGSCQCPHFTERGSDSRMGTKSARSLRADSQLRAPPRPTHWSVRLGPLGAPVSGTSSRLAWWQCGGSPAAVERGLRAGSAPWVLSSEIPPLPGPRPGPLSRPSPPVRAVAPVGAPSPTSASLFGIKILL